MREDRGGKQTKRYQEQSQPGAKSLWTKKKKSLRLYREQKLGEMKLESFGLGDGVRRAWRNHGY